MAATILVTKLFIPTARPEFVPRPRLLATLNFRSHNKLTLISAPAGFGKTTLAAEWVRTLRHADPTVSIAWLSLDARDNEIGQFLAYFIAAINHIEGLEKLGADLLPLLQSARPAPIETVLIPLTNEISTIPGRIVFVLDDYHLIEAQPIHQALSFLLDNLPPQIHLVLTTREDPLLPLSRLRAGGQLTELRAADLRFTSNEAAEFLNRVMGLHLSAPEIEALETRTEGWIAGLQLAALSLQGQVETAGLVQSFTGSNRLVLDYLMDEVMDRQPERVQEFLLNTAILDRFSAPLCDWITEWDNSQEILDTLDRKNIFIVPLDNERKWYRYHHLFTDLLRQRLWQTRPLQVPRLHRRVSAWFEAHDLPVDAIHHALQAQDYERVADLAEKIWPAWDTAQASATWLGWVQPIPDQIVRSRPVLCVAYAQALLAAGRLEQAETQLLHAERWLEVVADFGERPLLSNAPMVVTDEDRFCMLPAWVATTRAYHAQATGDTPGTEKYVRRALELYPADDQYNRAAVTGLLGLAYWANGDLESAYHTFSEGLFQNDHDRIKGTFVLVDMQMALGRLREAGGTCAYGLSLAGAFEPPTPVGTEDIYSAYSYVHLEGGDLQAADADLRMCRQLGEKVPLPDWRNRWCIAQARYEEAIGNFDEALALLEEATRVYVRTPVPEIRPIEAIRARIWLKQGRLAKALEWAWGLGIPGDNDLCYLREFEHITLARILLAHSHQEKENASTVKAIDLLRRLLAAAEKIGRNGSAIEILILLSLAEETRGTYSQANNWLARALELAEDQGYCRIFVDEGPSMARCLNSIRSQGISSSYVQWLLEAFSGEKGSETPSASSAGSFNWVEPLSEREMEVLHRMAQGMSNPEIAKRLFVTTNTVKAHTRNIYGKLDVHNRTQAITRAQALGILPAGGAGSKP